MDSTEIKYASWLAQKFNADEYKKQSDYHASDEIRYDAFVQKYRNSLELHLGLFGDFKGYAISLIGVYRIGWGEGEGSVKYVILENINSKKISFSEILNQLEKISDKYKDNFLIYSYTNSLHCKNLLEGFFSNKLIEECDSHSSILLLTSLLNDKLIFVVESIKQKVIENIQSYHPDDEEINHTVNSIFFALNGYVEEQQNYRYRCFVKAMSKELSKYRGFL